MTNIALLSRNRPRLLAQCLESLYKHTPEKEFSLCICDDGSDDFRTTRILHRYAEEHRNFCLIELHNSGHVLAQLKNLAVFYSRQRFGCGDWLYVGDSDTWFAPDWLSKLTIAAEHGERYGFRLFGGQIHPFHKECDPSFTIGKEPDEVKWTQHDVLDGPSWLMRWKTWREVGPLSRKCAPGTGQSEDHEWCQRLIAKEFGRIGVISPHVCVHTGLTNTAGEDVPGKQELLARIPIGVIAE